MLSGVRTEAQWLTVVAETRPRKRKGDGGGSETTDSMLSEVARRLSWGDEGVDVT